MDTRQLLGTSLRGTVPSPALPLSAGPARGLRHAHGADTSRRPFSSSSASLSLAGTSTSDAFGARTLAQTAQRRTVLVAAGGRTEAPPPPAPKRVAVAPDAASTVPEAHKVFDEIIITVKSGNGGNGEVVPDNRGRWVPNHKYKSGGNQSKTIWLPASQPGDGADGGDVVLVCDPSVDSLLHLHANGAAAAKAAKASKGGGGGGGGGGRGKDAGRPVFAARDGSNANPNTGSGGPKRNSEIKKARTAMLEIPVPPGTVVKRKGTGALMGELLQPGQRLTVARGGAGGHGVMAPNKEQQKARLSRAERDAYAKGVEVIAVEDDGWRADSRGQPGQQLGLTLLLRVVADCGLIGFPNAGKSSLLKTLTRASPTIAPYPFTTLMPNLGVLSAGGGANKAVLADLPGLIEGAHMGRGLGRNFLRHLRRTRALLHVVDAAAADPATDYYAVREELRMYNPDYCARPHVVALNKTDLLLDAEGETEALMAAIRDAARRQAVEHGEQSYEGPTPVPPVAVVPCSAATGEGLKELAAALQRALGAARVAELDQLRAAPDTLAAARGGGGGSGGGSDAASPVATAVVAGAAGTAAAVAAAVATPPPRIAARAPVTPGAPPPPPSGWDDGGSSSGGGSGWVDDAAEELDAGELDSFAERCREFGLMDDKGNFTATKLADDEDDEEEDEEQEVEGLADGGADEADNAEWLAELANLDEEAMAKVLAELEAEEAAEQAAEQAAAAEAAAASSASSAAPASAAAAAAAAAASPSARKATEAEVAAEAGRDVAADEADLAEMAALDDPDAALLGLSLEELLAMEADWEDSAPKGLM